MIKPMWLAAALLSVVSVLSGCGGGGGGAAEVGSGASPGTGGVPDGNAAGSWLSFSPASVSQSVKERSFALPIKIVATSSKTIAERINVAIVDSVGVLDPNATAVTALSDTRYEASLSLSPELKPGSYRGSFKVQICLDDPQTCKRPYPGSPWFIPFDIEVKPWAETRSVHKLLVSDTGVALTHTPNFSRLTRTIYVSDNLGASAQWQAKSDQPWLQVTPSGVAGAGGSALQIQADPSALPANAISYATVSINSADASIAAAEPVVVAVWKGESGVRQAVSRPTASSRYLGLLPDPVRPFVYAYGNGGVIDVYNVHTGAQVGTLSAAGATFRKMVASSDGAFLYAFDWTGGQIKVFDLRSGKLAASWLLDTAVSDFDSSYVDMAYARPNGVGVVVMTTGQVFRAIDGKVLARNLGQAPSGVWATQQLQSSYIAVSPDGMRLYSTDSRKYSPNTPFYIDIDYSEINAGALSFTRPMAARLSIEGRDTRLPQAGGIAVSRDGRRVLMLSYNQGISLWSPTDLSRTGMLTEGLSLESGTLVVTSDGKVVVPASGQMQFHILSEDGVLLKTQSTILPASLLRPGDAGSIYAWSPGLTVSSDGAVVVQRAYHQAERDFEYLLTFIPVSP